ncbi:MAG: CopD family protein [Thermoleophilaceae bacterium]|nr:CopD family protein [Thermoleophilaceae bacterium]
MRRVVAPVVALAVLAAAPAPAWGHATVEGTTPARGAQLERAPERVVFRFSEPVEAAFGAVQVYDQGGDRVDSGGASHPGGRSDEVAIGLRDGLGDGTYTATFRVVSADSHPVSGGFVFTVGEGGAPAATLDQLIDAGSAGRATEVGFGIVRGLSYLALALAIGGMAFAAAVWRPALRTRAGAGDGWRLAAEAFAGRARTITLGAVALGIVASALGIVFQGAVASGESFWRALEPDVIGEVLGTRFGTVWGLRLVAWVVLGGLLGLSLPRLRSTGLAAVSAFLCLTPALAGHASTLPPGWLLVPANFLHVTAMSIWVGGVATLLLALPAATRRLEPAERTGLLATVVNGFSSIALVAVGALVASGAVQAIAEVDALADLVDTAFGRAILIKIGLAAALIALGAWNRRRVRPRLAALDAAGETPGAAGVELRRTLRAEIALMAAVLGVTAALVSYAPATGATGPFSASERIGPARLELTVDPATAGASEMHLYMFDRRTGAQFGRVEELTVSARLPDREIGPLGLDAEKAGPGHYVVRRAALSPAGDWRLDVTARVSEFDAYTARLEVPVR